MSEQFKSKEQVANKTTECAIITGATLLGDQLLTETNKLLSVWGVTALQYDALHVLYVYDLSGIGLPSGEVGKYLSTRVPDVTRLLDRMAQKGWLTRERDTKNRRVVRARLTEIGIQLVESIYRPLQEMQKQQLSHLSESERNTLNKLLELANKKF